MAVEQNRYTKTGSKTEVGGGVPIEKVTGETVWQMVPQDSLSLRNSLGSVCVDARVIRDLIDAHLKGTVQDRLDHYKYDEIIRTTIDRRIEVAVKDAMRAVDADIKAIAAEHVRKRVIAEIDKQTFDVSVAVSDPK